MRMETAAAPSDNLRFTAGCDIDFVNFAILRSQHVDCTAR